MGPYEWKHNNATVYSQRYDSFQPNFSICSPGLSLQKLFVGNRENQI